MPAWNLAVVLDAVARDLPDRAAIVHGARRITWHELALRARSLASYLQTEAGLVPGDRVAIVLPNRPEYLESFYAVRKLQCVPLNVDIRSSVDTLHQVIDGSDAKVVVHAPEIESTVRDATRRIQKRWRPLLLAVGEPYEHAVANAVPPTDWSLEVPSGDDLVFIATREIRDGSAVLPAAPLAGGNALATALGVLTGGGRVVFVDAPRFDAQLVWRAVEHERIGTLTIAGGKFARPLLAALLDSSGERDLTSLRTISSSGARLSPEVTRALEAELPDVTVVDAYDSPGAPERSGRATIHPSEVEARLRKHPSVSDCVVVGISDSRVGKQVVALIQVSENHYIDEPEIAAWCRSRMPSTKTPGRFVFVETLERAPSGAVDYDRLRAVAIDALVRQL